MTFARIETANSPSRGLWNALAKLLFRRPEPEAPSELDRARAMRDAAAARYRDALRRSDTRDQHAYLSQHIKATNRVLKLEMGGRA